MADSISTYVTSSVEVDWVTRDNINEFRETPNGARIYKRTLAFLLSAVVYQGGNNASVEESIGASFIVSLSNSFDTSALHNAMKTLIDRNLVISPKLIERSAALAQFTAQGQPLTARRVELTPQPAVNCYSIQLELSDGSTVEYISLQNGRLLPHFGLIDKELMSLQPLSDRMLQLFYPRMNAGVFSLTKTPEPRLMEAYTKQKLWTKKIDFRSVTDVNQAIINSKGNYVVQLSEALHEFQIVNIATKIGGTPGEESAEAHPHLVLIAGPSSSGKTTFAKRLCVSLQTIGQKPIVLGVDSYYKDWQDIDSRGMEYVDWESLDSLNLELLNEHLISLLGGEEVYVPEYDMRTSTVKSKEHWVKTRLPEGGVIIMEGIHCLNPVLTSRVDKSNKFHIMISPLSALALDESIFASSTQVRMMRRMVRDHLFRGRSATSTLRQWPGVARGERKNIFPHQNNADVVMNSGLLFEANVLKIYAEPLLRTIMPDQEEYGEAQRLLSFCEQLVSLPGNIVPPQSLLREFIGGSWFYEYGGWYKTA